LKVGGIWLECDFVWQQERLIVELDGFAGHSSRTAFERDRARDRALNAADWRVVRVTWRQLRRERGALAADLSSMLGFRTQTSSA
jgi:very-short-patch-repair endonuclease